jgi:hypothetical protein
VRWIKQNKGKLKRSDTDFPEGDAFFVDGNGSKAIVNGKLYVNGKFTEETEIVVGNKKKVVKLGKKLPVGGGKK